MRLFAERGFRATSVGEIEGAVGRSRAGALYKHFPSKQALLEAAVRAHLDRPPPAPPRPARWKSVGAHRPDLALLRPIIHGLGHWFLDEMDRLKNLTRVLEHEGRRMAGLTSDVKNAMVD